MISLAGEVDLYTAPEFKQQLLEVIDQGGRDVDRRPQRHDVHRLDDARRARRRRQTAAHERAGSSRSSAATATSPRSSRSRASTASSRSTRPASGRRRGSAGVRSQSSARARRCLRCAARGRLAATGCGTDGLAEAARRRRRRQGALRREVRSVPHAGGRRHEGHDRPEPRRRVPAGARGRARRSDDPGGRPRPDRLCGRGAADRVAGDAGRPRHR